MTKPICTPTATREEFESILRELDRVTNLTWPLGSQLLSGMWLDSFKFLLLVNGNLQRISRRRKSYTILPRAEFISAIKRDFGKCKHPVWYDHKLKGSICLDCGIAEPDISKMETTGEEKPKMNYNKMTKAELIKNFEDQIKYYERTTQTRLDINHQLTQRQLELEKTNAEQAETIADLESRLENSGDIGNGWRVTAEDATKLAEELRAENIRIKFLAAQILCADVLEGK